MAKIESANPAVIPAAYQDGDFNSVTGTISGRFYTGGATSATSILKRKPETNSTLNRSQEITSK